jgi:hypothetical protein
MRRPHLSLRRPLARPHLRRQPRSPADLLGPNHPLARGEQFRRDLWRQSLLTAAALSLSAIAAASGWTWGLPFRIAVAIVQLGLAVVLGLHALLQRERARELIIEGRISLPLPVLERERRRLQAARRAAALADALEDLLQEAERWRPVLPGLRPIVDPRQVRAAAAELRAIAARRRPAPERSRPRGAIACLGRLGPLRPPAGGAPPGTRAHPGRSRAPGSDRVRSRALGNPRLAAR